MKITIFTLQLKKFGGIERFVTTLANMLAVKNEVTIVALYGSNKEKPAFAVSKNVHIEYLLPKLPDEISMKNIMAQKQFIKVIPELKRRFIINKKLRQAFKKYCNHLKTDIIITDRTMVSSLVGKFYNGTAKTIATDHNFHQNNQKYINALIKSLKKFDYLVVETKESAQFYKNIIGKTKCINIPNPLSNIPTQKSNLSSKNIIAVGRFVKEKDFLTLIDVMKKIVELDSEIKLFLVGDGEEFTAIKHKIVAANLQTRVVLTGALAQKDIAKYYYKSSLYIMTSKTEAFGLVMAEAMSYGLPVVAFDRTIGAREQVNSTNGILITNTDVTLMAETIVKLLADKSQLKKYQHGAIKSANQLDKKFIYKQWDKVLQN